MGAETSTPTAGTGEEVEVDEFMEQVIKLLQDPIDFQQSRPGVTTGRPYPDPLQQDRLHQPPPPQLGEYQRKSWEEQVDWSKTVQFKADEEEYLSLADGEREGMEKNLMFTNDDRLLRQMVQSMHHHPGLSLMSDILPPWVEEVYSSDPKLLAEIKEVRADFEDAFKKDHGHAEPSFLEALD